LTLGIETSCDETAAAVVRDGREVLSNVISSQIDLHARFGGVVPELASRAHLQSINGCVAAAMEEAGVGPSDLSLLAVTNRPGLVGSLLVGVCAAKAISLVHCLPLIGVHHIVGHVYASFLYAEPRFPFVALVASGGHSDVLLVAGHGQVRRLGATRDDAAGEALDKVARLLDLPYPGGPSIDRVARAYDGPVERFPQADLGGSLDFSFSGPKTAVSRLVMEVGPERLPERAPALAKGFEASVVDALVSHTLRAAEEHGVDMVVIGGGVAANSHLRESIVARAPEGVEVVIPPRVLCTDNAAMVAAAGHFWHAAGHSDGLDMDALATAPLG
jgi:N6-L-threonylcarbamoyladenine synthase